MPLTSTCHRCQVLTPKQKCCQCDRPEPHVYIKTDLLPASAAHEFLNRLERGGAVPATRLHALRKQAGPIGETVGSAAIKAVKGAAKAAKDVTDSLTDDQLSRLAAKVRTLDTKAMYTRELDLERGAFRIGVVAQTWSPIIPGKVAGSGMMSGSGFLVDLPGLGLVIITNGHVVRDASQIVVASALDPAKEIPCNVIRVSFELDVAFLRPDASHPAWRPADFRPFKLCGAQTSFVQKIDAIEAGHCGVARLEPVYAIGYPLGVPRVQITKGNVSGYQRISDEPVIQITAPINPGSSGGCLVNEAGEVLGITSSGIPSAQVTGFAIPVQTIYALQSAVADSSVYAKQHPAIRLPLFGLEYVPSSNFSRMTTEQPMPIIPKTGTQDRPPIGVEPGQVAFVAQKEGNKVGLASLTMATPQFPQGIVVTRVQPGSMFAQSDGDNTPLQPLDTILEFAGFVLNDDGLTAEETYPRRVSIEDLFRIQQFGASVSVVVRRGVRQFTNTYVFSEREEDLPVDEWIKENVQAAGGTPATSPGAVSSLGGQMLITQLSKNLIDALSAHYPHLSHYYRTQDGPRVVVLQDQSGGAEMGDVLRKIEGTQIQTVADAMRIVSKLAKDEPRYMLLEFDNGKNSLLYVNQNM